MGRLKAIEVAKEVSDMLNSGGAQKTEFVQAMNSEHRYLQGEFTDLCLRWVLNCAGDDYRYDGRNESSHIISKELVAHMKEKGWI